ncbi:MAG: MATE family efflux transporter [Clostridia bacterium]|nr:MATE family efflux transporter [Clostridia bacterium]
MKNKNSSSPPQKQELTLPRLVWPMMVETLLFMMLGMVDVLVMSRYDDLAASSVNTANQALSVLTIVFTVISGAGGILITQYLGAGKRQDASRAAALSIALQLAAGLIVSVVLLVFSAPILMFIGAKDTILTYSQQYLSVVGGFMFFQAVISSMTVIMRSHGNTKLPMFVTVGMNIVNTALDVILVPGLFGFPKMGIYGVAFATVLSRVGGCIVLAIVLFRRIEKPSCFRLLIPFPKKDTAKFFKVGVPSALETFLYNLSQLVITSIVLNCLTEKELIAKTYIQMITVLFYIFSVSIGQASQIIIGHLVGAGKTDEAYRQGVRSHKTALLIAFCASVAGILLRVPLISIFTDDSEVIGIASVVLIINLALEFGRTTNLVLIACLRGTGDVFYPTICAIVSNWLISVLGTYLMAVTFGMGIYGLWIALALDECVRGVLMVIRWRGGKWKTKKLTT